MSKKIVKYRKNENYLTYVSRNPPLAGKRWNGDDTGMQSDIKNDYSLWITELFNMDYKTVIQYLIDKYGEVDGNYFTDRSCQTVNI